MFIKFNIMKKMTEKGFSLIELLVVIAIIGLLSTMAVLSFNNARVKARDVKRMADIKSIQSAIEIYKTQSPQDVVPTPPDWSSLGVALSKTLTAIPTDPSANISNYFVYCRYFTPDNRYLLGGVLEQNMDISGDLDLNYDLTGMVCITSGSSTVSSFNCADSNNGNLTLPNQTVFCLGQM